MDFLRENKALRFILALAVFALCLWLVVSGQQLTGTPGGLLRMLAGLAGAVTPRVLGRTSSRLPDSLH